MLDQNINEHSTLKKSVLSITQLIVNQFIKTYKNKIKIYYLFYFCLKCEKKCKKIIL